MTTIDHYFSLISKVGMVVAFMKIDGRMHFFLLLSAISIKRISEFKQNWICFMMQFYKMTPVILCVFMFCLYQCWYCNYSLKLLNKPSIKWQLISVFTRVHEMYTFAHPCYVIRLVYVRYWYVMVRNIPGTKVIFQQSIKTSYFHRLLSALSQTTP